MQTYQRERERESLVFAQQTILAVPTLACYNNIYTTDVCHTWRHLFQRINIVKWKHSFTKQATFWN